MTSRQRLLTVLKGQIPDCVPVAPDFSNMIPARLTGKPFWDLYLYNDPPIWDAYIDCAKRFNIDSLMDGYFPYRAMPEEDQTPWEPFIVCRDAEKIITQDSYCENGRRIWQKHVTVYYADNPPSGRIPPEKIGLPSIPSKWAPVEGRKPVDVGVAGLKRVKELMGDQGLVGAWGGIASSAFGNSEGVYEYYDHPEKHEQWAQERLERAERYFTGLMAAEVKPDFLCVGGSGTLVFNTVEMIRKISLPAVFRVIELATAAGIPTHIHSCGPEKELVKIMAEESSLTVIDPLEIPPMGDCNLAELKRLHGRKITLKGNLHTTEVMLKGTADDVRRASRQAIDDAAEGGRFILSTGDQCGRDTPDENILAMVETARTYGRYAGA
ncbi:MAG: uroporphyrinogen decarboxylase family protein [Verrucomicrobiae bacterium]|nr:uroporphyrinogen decarboxylase family protein [Verrucomicrobiae bacterium]